LEHQDCKGINSIEGEMDGLRAGGCKGCGTCTLDRVGRGGLRWDGKRT